MKHSLRLLAAVVSLLVGTIAPDTLNAQQGGIRVWTDSEGRQIRASIEGFKDEGTIIFKLENGTSVPYSIAKLSDVDKGLAQTAFSKQGQSSNVDWENPQNSESYVIKSVRRQTAPGYVLSKSGWTWQTKCVEAKVEYKGSEASVKGNVRAYFYTRDGKLLDSVKEPPRRQDDERRYVNAPVNFAKGEAIEAYFPLTEFLEESDWATVVIAFGSGRDWSIDTMPRANLKDLDFPEKEYVFPNWEPVDEGDGPAPGSMSNVELEIRRIRVGDHRYALSFDGDYRDGMPCVSAEVRATGEIAPGDGKVKLHVFNDKGSLVDSRRGPSSAQIDGTGTYVGNPRVADERWHPVYFALDKGLAEKDHPTFVCVFEFGGKTTAVVESSVGATLDKLDFPGKNELTPKE